MDIQAIRAIKMVKDLQSDMYSYSLNLFNPATATFNVAMSGATTITYTGYYVSDYIPVVPGNKYVASGSQTKNYSWFDVNKVYISAGSSPDLTKLTSPSNAYFLRVTVSGVDFPTYQVVKGSTLPTYSAYGAKINPLFIYSRNLFNPSTSTYDTAMNGATTMAYTGYYASDYIPVVPGIYYVASGSQTKNFSWFDSTKNYISGGSSLTNLVAPNNAYFIRVTVSGVDFPTYQFEQGTTQTQYIPHGGKINRVDQMQAQSPSAANRFYGLRANFLGDSITWGYSPADDGSRLINPFPTLVGNTLGLSVVTNYGISGSTIGDNAGGVNAPFCNRYNQMDTSADLIFVLGGTNDWAKNVPLGTITDSTSATFYGALNILVAGLLNQYPTQTIVLATPMHRKGDTVANSVGSTLNDYRNAVINIGAKYGVAVLDLYATSGFFPDNTTNFGAICPDGRHPNDVGHQKLANRISGFLRTV